MNLYVFLLVSAMSRRTAGVERVRYWKHAKTGSDDEMSEPTGEEVVSYSTQQSIRSSVDILLGEVERSKKETFEVITAKYTRV